MLGKNHLITNIASTAIIFSGITFLAARPETNQLNEIAIAAKNYFIPLEENADMFNKIIFFALSFLGFWIGTYLPDIDSPSSKFGKIIHLPFKHRTWTHAVWFPLFLFILSFNINFLAWMCLGYVLHLFWDSLSSCGVCWLYPLSQYREYPNGAIVKKGHKIKLYKVGDITEKILIFTIVFLAISITVLTFIYR